METESDEIPGFTFPRWREEENEGRRRREEEEEEEGVRRNSSAQVGRYEMLTHIRKLVIANRQKGCFFEPLC